MYQSSRSTMSFIIRTISLLTSTLGLVGNSLSLTYFLLHERNGLPNHLMIILNSIDFLVEGYGLGYSLAIIGNHSHSSKAGNPCDSSNTGNSSDSSKLSENCSSDNPISCANKVFLLFSVTSGYITFKPISNKVNDSNISVLYNPQKILLS